MVDEMDLLSGMKAAEPLRPAAFDEARVLLRAAMAVEVVSDTKTGARRQTRWGMRRTGFGAVALGAAAAAAAVALVVTSTSAPRPAGPVASPAKAATPSSPLVSLAAVITANSGPLPGNASLIIRTQKEGGHPTEVSFNLYTDSGAYYGGADKKSLMQAIAEHQNMADGITASEVKAAVYAAVGNLSAARVQMVNASPNDLGLGLSTAAREKIWAKAQAELRRILIEKGIKNPPKQPLPTGKALYLDMDNSVWWNAVDALSAGGGNPQVRAGVLRLLSTVTGVTVAHSTTAGQPTLTITAGPQLGGKQVLTINAKTGMPISWWTGDLGPNVPSSLDTYKIFRVTFGDVEAGKF